VVEASAIAKVVALSLHKIAGDLRLLGSARGGPAEIALRRCVCRAADHARQGEPGHPEAVQR
jgi:fumarate hydratase class II